MKNFFIIIYLSILLLSPLVFVRAADPILPAPSGTPSNGCPSGANCGDYTLNDFLRIGINVSQWILGIVGSLSLLMFIYGGLMFLISSGSTDKITKAKGILKNAIIGLVIVFASYLIIKAVFSAFGITWTGGQIKF